MLEDQKLEAKKEAIKELIKMLQGMMVPESQEEPVEEVDVLPEEGDEIEEVEGELPGDGIEDLVKSEMKKTGKIKAPKSSMLAISMKSSKKPDFKKKWS